MASTGEAFMRELIDSLPTPHARMKAIAVLARWAGSTVYLPTQPKAARRVSAAGHALKNGMAPADVAAMLRARYNICAKQASRDVKKASKTQVLETCPSSTAE
jgi:hypothetical protein